MIRQYCEFKDPDNKIIPARIFGLVIAHRNKNLIIGLALGKVTYFWEFGK